MQRPIALKLLPEGSVEVHRVRTEPLDVSTLAKSFRGPAIILARNATLLSDLEAGLVDAGDIIAAKAGDWANAILIILPDTVDRHSSETSAASFNERIGDEKFLQSVTDTAPHLKILGRAIIDLIRAEGVGGDLVEKSKGRWVNAPVNSFTLKVQPRVGNFQFTIYGNPSSYDADDFLLQDQNSYSRGWVKNLSDAQKLASLIKLAYSRRLK